MERRIERIDDSKNRKKEKPTMVPKLNPLVSKKYIYIEWINH